MQAIGIVSVLASAVVALAATAVAARTQMRLHSLERRDARLSELRDVLDEAAEVVVRAQHVLADSEDLRAEVKWDREFWIMQARLQVRLGSDTKLYSDYMAIAEALEIVKNAHADDGDLSTEEAVRLWEEVHEAMDRFFAGTALIVGPDPQSLVPAAPHPSLREYVLSLRDGMRIRRALRRENTEYR